MCHGVEREARGRAPLTAEHFDHLMRIAHELGYQSINYDDLAAWRSGQRELPARPIMIDFDHPVRSMRYEVLDTLRRYGFTGNLFVHTGPVDTMYQAPLPPPAERQYMTWEEMGELLDAGWQIGAHTVTHPNLSQLSLEDPTGDRLRAELEQCDATLRQRLGITPRDFAFTGTSWSSVAEREVKQRYRFGRLWIVGATYEVDGKPMRYADLVGVPGQDEPDGGPPAAARYITPDSDPYRLPSMDLCRLIYQPDAFRRYLEGAFAINRVGDAPRTE
jgi:peptidoglycan/xylan/chitin deacetylase (PgdA/CDA1 family)